MAVSLKVMSGDPDEEIDVVWHCTKVQRLADQTEGQHLLFDFKILWAQIQLRWACTCI